MKKRISILLIFLISSCATFGQFIPNSRSQHADKTRGAGLSRSGQSFDEDLSRCLKCDAKGDWTNILDGLQKYSAQHSLTGNFGMISDESFFSRELLYLAEYVAANRKEAGGRGSELLRLSFLVALSDIEKNPDNWHEEFFSPRIFACSKLEQLGHEPVGGDFVLMCGLIRDGAAHFVKHLLPAFYCYYSENLKLLIRTQSGKTRLDAMDLFLSRTESEHEAFINKAVSPAFKKLNEYWDSLMAKDQLIPWDLAFTAMARQTVKAARTLRKSVLLGVLSELRDTDQITVTQWARLTTKYANPVTSAVLIWPDPVDVSEIDSVQPDRPNPNFKDSNYTRLLEDLIAQDSQGWMINKFMAGSVSHVTVSARDKLGRPLKIVGEYLFDGLYGETKGSVTVQFADGLPQCLYFYDSPTICKGPSPRITAAYKNGLYRQ